MLATIPSLRSLDERRRELRMSVTALARRSGVSRPTVNRILAGREHVPSAQSVHALAAALGLQVQLGYAPAVVPAIEAREFRRQQALTKARQLAKLVQGTMGLEAQAVDSKTLDGLVEDNLHALLSGSSRQLWDD